MKKTIISTERIEDPHYYDMTSQHAPKNHNWTVGYGFRMGDRAVSYIKCLQWRQNNPNSRLTILDDPWMQGTDLSRNLSSQWLFGDIADEIWTTERSEEELPKPEGKALYDKTLWMYWYELKNSNYNINPTIKPTQEAQESTKKLLNKLNVPKNFITFQPLMDAHYNTYRNAPAEWWEAIVEWIGDNIPIVIIGAYKTQMYCPRSAYPVYSYNMSPMESLALIDQAKMHVGGETGTTLWASTLNKPTVALYTPLDPWDHWCTEPLSFGSPVYKLNLGSRPDKIAIKIIEFYDKILSS